MLKRNLKEIIILVCLPLIASCGDLNKEEENTKNNKVNIIFKGEQLFRQNCTACHTIGGGISIGPDLKGITNKRNKDWIKQFTNNSTELIKSGDKDAIAIWEEFNRVAMASFNFSDEEFEAIYSYLKSKDINS